MVVLDAPQLNVKLRWLLRRRRAGPPSAAAAVRCPTCSARRAQTTAKHGRALATNPKVVLLDEPASGLDDVETSRLAGVLVSLAARHMAVLLVEHDIDLVMRLCSTVCVMDFGAVIATGTPNEVARNQRV